MVVTIAVGVVLARLELDRVHVVVPVSRYSHVTILDARRLLIAARTVRRSNAALTLVTLIVSVKSS